MLHNLFKEALSSITPGVPRSTRQGTSIESVQEEIHTRSLLFPDADALLQHHHDQVFPLPSSSMPALSSSALSFDINPEIDIDGKDVRFLIMQQQTSTLSAQLLYDSHVPANLEVKDPITVQNGSRPPIPPRRTSIGSAVAAEPPQSAFGRQRPVHAHKRTASIAETEGQRSAREYKEEIGIFSDCMFGSSEIMSYKGSGTKVHPLPSAAKSPSSFGDGNGSIGRSSMRGSRLAQSYTSESIMSGSASSGGSRASDRKRVLITRIFPVPLANPEQVDSKDEYPFPEVRPVNVAPSDLQASNGTVAAKDAQTENPDEEKKSNVPKDKKEQPKQRRTPAYAIGLLITLPAARARASDRSIISVGSYTDQESLPSSVSSSKPHGWTVLGEGFGVESLESSLIIDADDDIDLVTRHWDVIIRTLSHLQAIVASRVHVLLKQVDVTSPSPKPKSRTVSISISGRRVEQQLPKSTFAKLVQLSANALSRDPTIGVEINFARNRIVYGLKTLQVVTRQGRWGIWRDEARLVEKWAGGKETGFFFYNLMTAFLGTHKDWLQALAPQAYRRRHYQHSRTNKEDELPISARTVVVGTDKMATRRMVFLLAAFLMPNQQQQLPYTRSYRPSTTTSFGGYSQSPPSYMPSREESLRRKVNRRKHTHNRTQSFPTQPIQDRERRNSELKTANLPIPGSDGGTRKSSAATTTTVTPVATIPHFSTLQRSIRGTGPIPRPGSSGSFATEDLIKYNLKRGDSSGQYSNASSESQFSRWGSWGAKVGLWQRRDSTGGTEVAVEEEEPQPNKLVQMVEEANASSAPVKPAVTYQIHEAQPPKIQSAPAPYESPFKTSVDEEGVIDVEVPLPDFLSAFGSVVSSPSSSGYLSGMGPGLEGFEHYGAGRDADTPLNVGGWLPSFHPDFTLQGIPPQEKLEDDIKKWMRAEPTPSLSKSFQSGWMDISTILIADTTTFTIKRIKYARFVTAPTPGDSKDGVAAIGAQLQASSIYGSQYDGAARITPASDMKVEDKFVEDYVMSLDEVLTEAIERVIAQPTSQGASDSTLVPHDDKQERSRDSSTSKSSASNSKGRVRSSSNDTQTGTVHKERKDVPRNECKKCILGALEERVKDVVEVRREGQKVAGNGAKDGNVLKEGINDWLGALD